MARRAGRPLRAIKAFWDTSALVPLCVLQPATPQAIALCNRYDPVVWWGTPVEICGALARLLRMQGISPGGHAQAKGLANSLARSWDVIQPSDVLRQNAMLLIERYDLRAADSFQLAAALEWCEGSPQGYVFITADQRLGESALLSGFDVRQV